MKLSIVLATKNEENNIEACLESVKGLADEIIIFDERSTDNTIELAKKYNAKITEYLHKTNFHETKQKAINAANGDWILQLDADERVTPQLSEEIKKVINMNYKELAIRKPLTEKQKKLFERHQQLIEQREGKLGKLTGEVAAFFIPRRNYFLGKILIHAGVYPDGVIRLFKKGKARLPGKSVHEVMEVDGEVGWIYNDLEHHDSPTIKRYLDRMNRYTDIKVEEFDKSKLPANVWNLFKYSFLLPITYFLSLYIRHKGILDGTRGFLWSALSSMHFPIAYFKYWQTVKQ